jgi:hypothetical protein
MKRSIFLVFIFLMMSTAGIFATTAAKKPMTTKAATAAAAKTPMNHGIFNADSLQWSNAPAVMPAGAMLAVMEGNPLEDGAVYYAPENARRLQNSASLSPWSGTRYRDYRHLKDRNG